MAGTAVRNETNDAEFGVQDMRRVTSGTSGPVRPAQVFQEGDQSINYDVDGCDTDFQEGGTGDDDDVVLEEVLDGGTGAMG